MSDLTTRYYRHKKTGGDYLVLHEATNESDLAPVIVYQSIKTGDVWVRPRAEFFDGRFDLMFGYTVPDGESGAPRMAIKRPVARDDLVKRIDSTDHIKLMRANPDDSDEMVSETLSVEEHEAIVEALRAASRIEALEEQDAAAATHVESVICMRTDFTGNPPYVGWKGLGLALNEALDERDRLSADLEAAREALERLDKMFTIKLGQPGLGGEHRIGDVHKIVCETLSRLSKKESSS